MKQKAILRALSPLVGVAFAAAFLLGFDFQLAKAAAAQKEVEKVERVEKAEKKKIKPAVTKEAVPVKRGKIDMLPKKDRPVESVTGVTPQIARKLREAGIVTVGDLAKATPMKMKSIDSKTRKAIIRRARARLKSN